LPVATVAAPAGTALFGTDILGTAATWTFAGATSNGLGTAAGHWLVGDNASTIWQESKRAAVVGGGLGLAGGTLSRADIYLTGPARFSLVTPLEFGSPGVLRTGMTNFLYGNPGSGSVILAANGGSRAPLALGPIPENPRAYSVAFEAQLAPSQ